MIERDLESCHDASDSEYIGRLSFESDSDADEVVEIRKAGDRSCYEGR